MEHTPTNPPTTPKQIKEDPSKIKLLSTLRLLLLEAIGTENLDRSPNTKEKIKDLVARCVLETDINPVEFFNEYLYLLAEGSGATTNEEFERTKKILSNLSSFIAERYLEATRSKNIAHESITKSKNL